MMGSRKLGLLLLSLVCSGAHAQIYMCKDASGRTITSDRPIPECADRSMRELDKNGTARREIAAPLTAEQRRQQQLQEEKRRADEAVAEEQRRADRAIRARYQKESDIELARKRSLEPVEEQIRREKLTLVSAEKHQQQTYAEVDALKKKSATVPAALQRKAADADQAVASSKKQLKDYETEHEQINVRFDTTLKRFREIVGTTAAK